jgi:hypothetical protein
MGLDISMSCPAKAPSEGQAESGALDASMLVARRPSYTGLEDPLDVGLCHARTIVLHGVRDRSIGTPLGREGDPALAVIGT